MAVSHRYYGIKIVAGRGDLLMGGEDPDGQWLASYDPDAFDGRGGGSWTLDPQRAMAFADLAAALACYRQVSRVRPVRADGRPNRPLTAFTVTFEPLPFSR